VIIIIIIISASVAVPEPGAGGAENKMPPGEAAVIINGSGSLLFY
jgi:hypothetical protein